MNGAAAGRQHLRAALEQARDHARLAGAEIGLAMLGENFRRWSCRRRFSISASASTNGMPSRAASRRPTEDLPAPIMPTSTIERRPSARGERAAAAPDRRRFCRAVHGMTTFRPCYELHTPNPRDGLTTVAVEHDRTPADLRSRLASATMPSLFRFLVSSALLGGLVYGGVFCARQFRDLATARDHRHDSARQIPQASRAEPRWRRRPSAERRDADRTVPRHAGGRARRRRQYAGRLSPRSRRSRRPSRASRQHVADADDRRPARLSRPASPSAASRHPRWRGGCRRCASSIVFSTPKDIAATIRPPCWKGPSAAARCRRC